MSVGDRVEVSVNDRSYKATIQRVDTVTNMIGVAYEDGYSEKSIPLRRIVKFTQSAALSVEGKASVDPARDPNSVMGMVGLL